MQKTIQKISNFDKWCSDRPQNWKVTSKIPFDMDQKSQFFKNKLYMDQNSQNSPPKLHQNTLYYYPTFLVFTSKIPYNMAKKVKICLKITI